MLLQPRLEPGTRRPQDISKTSLPVKLRLLPHTQFGAVIPYRLFENSSDAAIHGPKANCIPQKTIALKLRRHKS